MPATLVPLEEIAAEMGATVEIVVARLAATGRGEPGVDWRGQPVVSPEVAAELVAEFRQEVREEAERRAAYDAYLADRQEHRRAAGAEAAEKAMRAQYEIGSRRRAERYAAFSVLGGTLRYSPAELTAGRAARLEAYAEFDAANPVDPFEAFKP
jgi:hypothetical protein